MFIRLVNGISPIMLYVLYFVKGLFLAIVFTAIYLILRPRPLYTIKFSDGLPKKVQGKVAKRFLNDCQDIASDCHIKKGTIKAFSRGKQITLRFSRHIAKKYHQRFRNAWHSQ